MKTKYIWLLAGLIGFSACQSDDDSSTAAKVFPAATSGTADFSKFVSVGASFSAGYTDGALFKAAQEKSFPKLLSEKFSLVGGGAFTQPLMNDNTGGLLVGGVPVAEYRLIFNGSGPQRLNDFLTGLGAPVPPITTDAAVNLMSTFNNYAVPGAKSFHITLPGYGALNPYFGRMASSGSASMLGDAAAQVPTFFTFSEIGGNDVLGYATSGGIGVDQTGNFNPASYGPNDITDPTVFKNVVDGALAVLTSNGTGAKGVVANVPYVSSLPYFTTVPHNPVPLDAATAAQLNAGYAAYNGGLQFALGNSLLTQAEVEKRTVVFSESQTNALVLVDEDLTDLTAFGIPNYRQATEADLLVLPLSSLIPQGYGTQIQLEDQWVLTPEEQLAIKTATDAYNQHLQDAVDLYGLALVDFKSILEQASTTGVLSGQYLLTTDLVTGGLVSLDGVHLTTRGYAVLANEMMKVIDTTYGSNFEASGNMFDPADFPVVYSPSLQ